MTEKDDKKLTELHALLSIVGVFFILFLLSGSIYLLNSIAMDYKPMIVESKSANFVSSLDRIQDNCKSTHIITKKYGDDEYYVFVQVEENNYDDYVYLPLEYCLRDKKEGG